MDRLRLAKLTGINACNTQPHALPTLRVVNFFLPPETKVPPVETDFWCARQARKP
jgi:hypothetical protein